MLRAASISAALLAIAVPATHAGDILRGGAPMAGTRARTASGGGTGSAAAAQLQTNARDRLARTTATVNSVKALQAAAREAAAASRLSLGRARLPKVPDGLAKNGLQPAPGVPKNLNKPKPGEDPSLWIGAKLPTESGKKGGAKNVTILQTDQQALLTWQTFNVGKKTTLTFDQSAGGSDKTKWIAFNKINDPKARPSQILGQIKADGQVYILNQNGILFANNSQVNTHSLTASALPINPSLVSQGLLNNPNALFLFNALVSDTFSVTQKSRLLSQTVEPGSALAVKYTNQNNEQVSLVAGEDYTVVQDENKQTTVALTDAGTAKLTSNDVSIAIKADTVLAVGYVSPSGDVVVDAGAQLSSPSSAAKTGGRVMLVGANVKNAGTISTPDGQTILAAGLQVGIDSHSADDPAIRGIDVYIGAVANSADKKAKDGGRAVNRGLIEIPRGNATIAGRNVVQLGAIDSSTSVSLNGSVRLDANYDAVSNVAFDAAKPENGPPFLYKSTGHVTLGKGSVTRILPELGSSERIIGTELAIPSRIEMTGHTIHLDDDAATLAPNATVNLTAGSWYFTSPENPGPTDPASSTFVYTDGQVYADQGSLIDVAGTTSAIAPLSENIMKVQFRGAELSDSPLQRTGPLRARNIIIDLRNTGTFNGRKWYGTPLADASGFLNLIQRSVDELTTAGGDVTIHSGGSVVLQRGSMVDVSGGWLKYPAGFVRATTRLVAGSRIIDIADATPDIVYDGIYNPKFTQEHAKWGISHTYKHPFALPRTVYESGYVAGRDGGSISITAPSMALDGRLAGNTTAGTRQLRNSSGNTELPAGGKLALVFKAQDTAFYNSTQFPDFSPTPPKIVFRDIPNQPDIPAFSNQNAQPLTGRLSRLVLSSGLLNADGFGSLTVDNREGDIVIPAGVSIRAQPGTSITMLGANIDVLGDISAPGGSLSFTAYDFSPYQADILSGGERNFIPDFQSPLSDPFRGNVTLGERASLSTAGVITDDRLTTGATPFVDPIVRDGGAISIVGYSADLQKGGLIDVSGGVSVDVKGRISYGDAGAVSIITGSDPKLASLTGGRLKLASKLAAYSGAKGGSLTLRAPLIRIGDLPPKPGEFVLRPEFFNQGGFTSFSLSGLPSLPQRPSPFGGVGSFDLAASLDPIAPNRFLPGLVVEPGTTISPVVTSLFALPMVPGEDRVLLQPLLLDPALRPPVSLGFASERVKDSFSGEFLVRGDLIVGEGASIDAGPAGSVSLSGDTVAVMGTVRAPGGSIKVAGAGSYPVANAAITSHARSTVYFGPQSELSTRGVAVLRPDPFNRRIGSVLPGGSISVSGNILAEAGSLFDVSGASVTLDLSPAAAGLFQGEDSPVVPVTSGVLGPLYSRFTIPVQVDSDGGSITLKGSEEMFVDATLRGAAGGPAALGGSLSVSSGRFYGDPSQLHLPTDVSLVVTQSGDKLPPGYKPSGKSGVGDVLVDADGNHIPGRGYFAADSFQNGGFDSLTLAGTVKFSGPVSIQARQKISVATGQVLVSGGVLVADDKVDLSAPYVSLGTLFNGPLQPDDPALASAFAVGGQPYFVRPKHGPGSLTVRAELIDVGNLSLRNIGLASLVADGGDIRGDGTLDIAGKLYLRAGQIYPVTGSNFTISAYDYKTKGQEPGDPFKKGVVTIASSGERQLPLSAGGKLSIFASVIRQGGVLRAPLGTIDLGWNGEGVAPRDILSGRGVPVADRLVLRAGSETSVSALDSSTGRESIIPYGIVLNGTSWIDPAGLDITAGGVPAKNVSLSADKLSTKPGSVIDISGGGNLYAYQWLTGQGGTQDILASAGSFAVIPGYQANFAPYAPFNLATGSANLGTDPGYVNTSLSVGDSVHLGASAGLPAGDYTLLPARYALLPGAFLVTPQTGPSRGALALPDGSSLVSGYRFNGMGDVSARRLLYSRFEVVSAPVVRARAQYEDFYANKFLRQSAHALGVQTPRLPADAGHLVFEAAQAMQLAGAVAAKPAGKGIGAYIDISSPVDILISGTQAKSGKTEGETKPLILDPDLLSGFEAESLLIGGVRTDGSDGTTVAVKTGGITLDNRGQPLSGPEVILAARDKLTLANGAEIEQSGAMVADAQKLLLDGDGVLLRVSSDPGAEIVRTGVTGSTGQAMVIGKNARIQGGSIILDSSHATSLSSNARLLGDYVTLDSGQISLLLNGSTKVRPTEGLVLAGRVLDDLQNARALSFLSYSSIDIYGAGRFHIDGSLELHAGEIRGFDTRGGTVGFEAATVLLDNSARASRPGPDGALDGTLAFNADTITLGASRLDVDQFARTSLNASQGILLHGAGRLLVQGGLTATTPFITAIAPSTQRIAAGGDLRVVASNAPFSGLPAGVLGSSLTLEGGSVTVNSDVVLPSGLLTLRATESDVNVGGRLDVGGTEQTFYDIVKYTDAGTVSLISDNGDVKLGRGSSISVAAQAAGGNAGTLSIGTPKGNFSLDGKLEASGGRRGRNGSFVLDAGELPKLTALDAMLNDAAFTESRAIRVRTGDVLIDGAAQAHSYHVSADAGSITVAGTIDASGDRGGDIALQAAGGLTLLDGSKLTVSGKDFDSAGKGGAILLEAASQTDGAFDTGALLDIRSGSEIDLGVSSADAGSAGFGRFTGTLHLRAPQTAGNTDVQIAPIDGTIRGASSIIVEGYALFDLTASGGDISTTVRNAVNANATTFLGASGATTATYTAMHDRLLANNAALDSVLSIRPGAEVINRAGDLTLGTASSTGSSDWNFNNARFGPIKAPGILTLRAAGNLVFYNGLQDGFQINNALTAYTARLMDPNPLLPTNAQSWSFRLVSGADLAAADFRQVQPLSALAENSGSLLLGKDADKGGIANPFGSGALTRNAINGGSNPSGRFYQVIRTGSGDIDISAGRDVQLLNQFATIYTAGTLIANPAAIDGGFDMPILNATASGSLGAIQQAPSYPVQYTLGGGNVSIHAQGDIIHLDRATNGDLIADSERQLPLDWLYRRGFVDPISGEFGAARFGDIASTTWWVDFSNFFEGVGALGGGNVSLVAGRNVSNVDAVIPTNARMPKGRPDISKLVELGGGDLLVRAGHDIDAGVYYVERGRGTLDAGGSIVTNGTRSPSRTNLINEDPYPEQTWLPTTLFVGKGGFDVSARGDLLLGPAANLFLMPGGFNNTYWYKTYFSTYSPGSYVNATSLGGTLTLRQSTTLPSETGASPLLYIWLRDVLLLGPLPNPSYYQPWLRLNETSVAPFYTATTIMPGTLRATAFSGDVNLAGGLNLSPSPRGTVDLAAGGSINGLQINGLTTPANIQLNAWGSSRIDLSDASPDAIPGVDTPFAYQSIVGTVQNARATGSNVLSFVDSLFQETGSLSTALQSKQTLHGNSLLHADDPNPVHLYARQGDISGITLFAGKPARVVAGRDITDIAFYVQNNSPDDLTIVSAGRDIIAYDANSPLRSSAVADGNMLNTGENPLAGDIQVGGPGSLEVLAGRNLDLGIGESNDDGTAAGITSVGNARNPYLPFDGAQLVVGAGIGFSNGLADSNLDFESFIADFIAGDSGGRYFSELGAIVDAKSTEQRFTVEDFEALSQGEQDRLALDVFYLALRDAGRDHNLDGANYEGGFAAIDSLFGKRKWRGDIDTRARNIRTKNGGNIAIFAPGGGLQLSNMVIGNPLVPPGIITETGGSISIFTHDDVDIGIGRIFTLRGGNEIIWSSAGDIAAGSAAKTVASAPPTRVLLDPQSADVQTDLAGLSTGGGIGVLATVEGVPPGDVDLIAPVGVVDAGDAGIRVSGNLNIAATRVLNASNITVVGQSSGVPAAAPVSAPNVAGLSSGANAAGATSNAANDIANQARQQPAQDEAPSIINVDVIGYGGADAPQG